MTRFNPQWHTLGAGWGLELTELQAFQQTASPQTSPQISGLDIKCATSKGANMTRRFGKVRQLASGKWQASYTDPNGLRVFAPQTYNRESDAETWLATVRADLARGTWRPAETGGQLLRDYAGTWLTQREDLRPRTVALYAGLLKRHVLPRLGDKALREITPAVVRSWFSALGTTTGQTARAQSYRLLRTILNQAVRDGEITANPCQIRGAGTPKHPERVPPTFAQIQAVAVAMPARYRALVLVAAFGGLRRGELCALTRADIELPADPGGLVTVGVCKALSRVGGRWLIGAPKTEAGIRKVVLPAFLTPVMVEHMGRHVGDSPTALVFGTASGLPLAGSNLCATLARAQNRAGVEPFPFHSLRHAAATTALQAGATVKDTMARIGHASPRAALIYQHSAASRSELIARALDEAIAEAESGNVVPLRKRATG